MEGVIILEKERKLSVVRQYDVVVLGGGVAGVAAAIAAARQGAKTLLVEEQYILGGLATSGLIAYYLPLCDGQGVQLSYGLAEELLKLSISVGEDRHYPTAWLNGENIEERKKVRYLTQFNPNVFALLLDGELTKSGGEILFGTRLSDCVINGENNKIEAVILENRSGRFAVTAKNFIDTTGDAALCLMAGEETALYERKNEIAAWYYETVDGIYTLKEVGCRDTDEAYEVIGRFQGVDGKELSDVTLQTHKITLERFLEGGNNGKMHALATLPTIPQVRMTRKLIGKGTMTMADDHKSFEDSVGMFGNWRKKGPAFEMPFGCLIGKKILNLGTAGRCISVDDDMWDLTRVIPPCVLSGEAIGTAAAISENVAETDVIQLQKILRNNQVKLHLSEVGIENL